MKKLKINNRIISNVFKELERFFFREGPRQYRDIIRDKDYFFENNKEEIIHIIEKYLKEENFDENTTFDPFDSSSEGLTDDILNRKREDNDRYLGLYYRMQCPENGTVVLKAKNLCLFYWYVIKELMIANHSFSRVLLKDICDRVIKKTLYHELFHHYTDFNRSFNKSVKYKFLIEEALAVAFSRIYLGHETTGSGLTTDFFKIAYKYRGLGYRDWVHYQNENNFLDELIKYSGFEMNCLNNPDIDSLKTISQLYLESVVQNPKVNIEIE